VQLCLAIRRRVLNCMFGVFDSHHHAILNAHLWLLAQDMLGEVYACGVLCAGKEPSLCQKHGTRHPASYDEPRLAMPVFSWTPFAAPMDPSGGAMASIFLRVVIDSGKHKVR
jgi:hypothetical protein